MKEQERVKQWLAEGKEVKIFTARAAIDQKCLVTGRFWQKHEIIEVIQNWTEKHLGQRLEVTATKDFRMIVLYDDSLQTGRGEHRQNYWSGVEFKTRKESK